MTPQQTSDLRTLHYLDQHEAHMRDRIATMGARAADKVGEALLGPSAGLRKLTDKQLDLVADLACLALGRAMLAAFGCLGGDKCDQP